MESKALALGVFLESKALAKRRVRPTHLNFLVSNFSTRQFVHSFFRSLTAVTEINGAWEHPTLSEMNAFPSVIWERERAISNYELNVI